MKKTLYTLAASLLLTASACDVLDIDPTNTYSETTAYASEKNLDLYVKGFYSYLGYAADISCSSTCLTDDGASDLLKHSWYGVDGGMMNRMFYLKNYVTPEGNFRDLWGTWYSVIRNINEFLVDYNNGMVKLPDNIVRTRVAEARYIRAFAYLDLVLRHGGVPLRIDDNGKVDDHLDNAKARTSTEECWDFIINEFDYCSKILPLAWTPSEAGRLTKGAAFGMKARAALYAKRWDVAEEACDSVFETGQYELMPGATVDLYNRIFTTPNNLELLVTVYYQAGKKQHQWNSLMCPVADGDRFGVNTGAAVTPTEEYQQRFDIKVGNDWKAFDWADLPSYTDGPYANRDPRFYASILYNDASWMGRRLQIYPGGTDEPMVFNTVGQDNVHKTTTGYYIRKFMTTSTEYNFTSVLSGQYWTEMRLAEIYLIRSEARARQNRWTPAYTDLNAVRTRAGMPAYAVSTSWSEYLADLEKERICELGLEGHRGIDIIRWGKSQEVLNGQRVHGIWITKTASGFNYEVIDADTQDRYFPPKYDIFPIPYNEIRNNPLCTQNEEWLQ